MMKLEDSIGPDYDEFMRDVQTRLMEIRNSYQEICKQGKEVYITERHPAECENTYVTLFCLTPKTETISKEDESYRLTPEEIELVEQQSFFQENVEFLNRLRQGHARITPFSIYDLMENLGNVSGISNLFYTFLNGDEEGKPVIAGDIDEY